MGHPVVHFEFWSTQPDNVSSFYSEVFDWKIDYNSELTYWLVETGGEGGINGGMFKPHEGDLPAKLSLYIQVDDVDAFLQKAGAHGAKTIVPPMEIPGVGRSAIFLDPEQRAIGLFTPVGS